MLPNDVHKRCRRDAAGSRGQSPAAALLGRLARLGIRAGVRRWRAGYTACGVTAHLDLPAAIAGSRGLSREVAIVGAALRVGVPVTVVVEDPYRQVGSVEIQPFRDRFCAFLERTNVDRRLLGLCLSALEFPDAASRSELRPRLGEGPRYVSLPGKRGASEDLALNDVWAVLQRSETNGPRFWPAHPAGVRSRCPLLPSESSTTLLPGSGIAAPANTAWLPLTFDICRVADHEGNVCLSALSSVLDACVDLGDRLLDRLTWFDPRQRRDARSNRRLAVIVDGFGDLVVRRGEDPSDWQSLRRLDRLVSGLHEGLWQRSRALAAQRGLLPALLEREPKWAWCDETHVRRFRDRWRQALETQQVRNRNLLVLSPYSVLPRRRATVEFADLLPALVHADAFSFSSAPALDHWQACDFRAFHQRLQALVMHHNAASFVAAGA